MDPDVAISAKHITKSYKLYASSLERAMAPFRKKDNAKRFVALKDFNVDFPKGEAIAILGKNGSGKSTLLKIITGVTTPTKGTIEVDGRISAMLELTSGFDPELTGIENIALRALALGISDTEIARTQQDIIDFADIGDHIYQPVRTYSSGMKARLGFAVSVNVDPDILIVDEVLAVGDSAFKLKCTAKMDEFRQSGKTILFVSHSLHTVKAFCTRALWLKEGVMQNYGEMGLVVQEYEDYLRAERAKMRAKEREAMRQILADDEDGDEAPLEKSDLVDIRRFKMFDSNGKETNVFRAGEDINYEFEYEVKREVPQLRLCYTIRNAEDIAIFVSDKQNEATAVDSSIGKHKVKMRLKTPFLLAGEYKLSGEFWGVSSSFERGYSNRRSFFITQDKFIGSGIVHIDCALDVDGKEIVG